MHITMEIYINGTRLNGEKGKEGLAYLLHHERDNSVYVPGCAINTPYRKDLNGTFSWHLEDQINDLFKNKIQPKLDECTAKGEKLILKIYGLSRGGIGAFSLCQKLKNIPEDRLEIHLAVVDPVPGNLKITSWFDKFFGFNYTWTNRTMDLSDSINLKNILIFLANEPYAPAHASLLPIVPPATQCHTKVEIAPGGHSNLELNAIVHKQIRAFLNSNGTTTVLSIDKEELLAAYDIACCEAIASRRGMQLGNEVITQLDSDRIYWNTHHQQLQGIEPNPDTCICRLKHPASHPKSKSQILKEGFYNILAFLWAIISYPIKLFKKEPVPTPRASSQPHTRVPTSTQPHKRRHNKNLAYRLKKLHWLFSSSKPKPLSPIPTTTPRPVLPNLSL